MVRRYDDQHVGAGVGESLHEPVRHGLGGRSIEHGVREVELGVGGGDRFVGERMTHVLVGEVGVLTRLATVVTRLGRRAIRVDHPVDLGLRETEPTNPFVFVEHGLRR